MEDEARQKAVRDYITNLLWDPNGMDIDSIGNSAIKYLNLEPAVVPHDIGPALGSLVDAGVIEGFHRIDSEGNKLCFKPVKFITPKFAKFHCYILGHDVPADLAFEYYLALFEGGFCRRCGKLIQGKFLGNVWTEEIEEVRVLTDVEMENATENKKRVSATVKDILGDDLEPEMAEKLDEMDREPPERVQTMCVLKGYDVSPATNRGLKVVRLP